jgi:Sigma-70, region 4
VPLGPEARYEQSEAISLAFVSALQLLPARQRAVLILREVLGYHAKEVAAMLHSSVESVNSALKRARASLRHHLPPSGEGEAPPAPYSLEYHGRDAVARFCASIFGSGRRFDLVPRRANGQPAFGTYLRAPTGGIRHGTGLLVLTLTGERICALTRFENSVLPWFGLPRSLPS